MSNTETALCAFEYPSFENPRNGAQDDVPTFTWKVGLANKSQVWSSEAAAADKEKALVKHECLHIKNRQTNEERVFAREDKYSVKEMAINESSDIIEEFLYDMLRTLFLKAKMQDPVSSL